MSRSVNSPRSSVADEWEEVQLLDGDDPLSHLHRRLDRRFKSVDQRLDATRLQIDHVRLTLTQQIAQARRDMTALVLWALLGTIVITAAMCLGTIALIR